MYCIIILSSDRALHILFARLFIARFDYHFYERMMMMMMIATSPFASLELSSADRHVAAVTARLQAIAQDCPVCPLLRL